MEKANILENRKYMIGGIILAIVAIYIFRLAQLQLISDEYKTKADSNAYYRSVIFPSRGNIYDRKGELLAYNELAYSVTIEDVYESGSDKNERLNQTIKTLIGMIEENGDSIVTDFNIILDSNGEYQFTVSGTQLQRFLADIYGKAYIDKLTYAEKTSTPDDVINYLAGKNKFAIGEYTVPNNHKSAFQIGKGYSKEMMLKMINIRYAMSLNNFQKYIATTVATILQARQFVTYATRLTSKTLFVCSVLHSSLQDLVSTSLPRQSPFPVRYRESWLTCLANGLSRRCTRP